MRKEEAWNLSVATSFPITRSRAEVDQALATLRENGFDVKEYDRP